VVDEQADVPQLRLLPGAEIECIDVELGPEPLDVLTNAVVVELNPLLYRVLSLDPVGRFEPLLRAGTGGTEQPVVLVEPLEQDGGDVARGASAWRRGQASAGRARTR
jgi:hypothetical protein